MPVDPQALFIVLISGRAVGVVVNPAFLQQPGMAARITAGVGGDMVLVFLLVRYPVIVIIAKKLMLYGQSGAFVTGGGGNIVVTAAVPGDADIRSLLAVIAYLIEKCTSGDRELIAVQGQIVFNCGIDGVCRFLQFVFPGFPETAGDHQGSGGRNQKPFTFP